MPPTVNSLSILAGALAKLEVATWAANYAATPFTDLGALRDIQCETEVTTAEAEADNVLAALAYYNTKQKVTVKGKLMEVDLEALALVMGLPSTAVSLVARVPTVTDGTATLKFPSTDDIQYKTVRLTVDNVSLTPGYTGPITDTYTSHVITFARCVPKVKTSELFKKNGVWECPFEFEACYDSSVLTTNIGAELYKIVQTAPK